MVAAVIDRPSCKRLQARSDRDRLRAAMDAGGLLDVPTDGGAPILEARRVSKTYGHITALNDVSLALLPGEIHALVGDNGAGKSTLVKILSGAEVPTRGHVFANGRHIEFAGPQGAFDAGVIAVHQNLALVGCRSVSQNLFLGREPTRFGLVRAREMARESRDLLASMRQVNLTDVNASVSNLSGGQRQAIAVSRAVSQDKTVLILDEPTAALGVTEAHRTLDLIDGLRADRRTVLIVSHNLSHVLRIADRITVLRGGVNVGTVLKRDADAQSIVTVITGAGEL